MRKWKLLGWAYVIVLAGLILLAFHDEIFGGYYPHIPVVEWSGSISGIGPDADSVRWEAYFPANATTPVITDTMTAKTDQRYTNGSHTTDTAGLWFYRYLVFYGNDTIKASDYVAIGDSLHADPTDYMAASAGSGLQVDSIFVYDTSGTDTPVQGVSVTIKNAGLTANAGYGAITNSSGYVIYFLDASTEYNGVARATAYTFDIYNFTTGSGATNNDTIWGYDFAPTPLSSSTQKTTLYDWALGPRGDTLAYATVKITLNGSGPMYTTTETITKKTQTVYTDANGYWTALVFGTDSTKNCDNITIEIIEAGATDAVNKFEKVVVPANGLTTQLRSLLKP